jgi:predicted ArsR family transcriptional regulator
MSQGLIEREVSRASRGRPSHRYLLTEKGRRQTGANFIDLALALWQEIRAIKDEDVRKGLLQRVAGHLADAYRPQVTGRTVGERMEEVKDLFAERKVPFEVERSGSLPVLTALACPYPELAEQDRGICAVESMLFRELLGGDVRLTDCRLDGESTCCRFESRS